MSVPAAECKLGVGAAGTMDNGIHITLDGADAMMRYDEMHIDAESFGPRGPSMTTTIHSNACTLTLDCKTLDVKTCHGAVTGTVYATGDSGQQPLLCAGHWTLINDGSGDVVFRVVVAASPVLADATSIVDTRRLVPYAEHESVDHYATLIQEHNLGVAGGGIHFAVCSGRIGGGMPRGLRVVSRAKTPLPFPTAAAAGGPPIAPSSTLPKSDDPTRRATTTANVYLFWCLIASDRNDPYPLLSRVSGASLPASHLTP